MGKEKVYCALCEHLSEFNIYKVRRKDGNDCIAAYCEHKKAKHEFLYTYRPFGGLRSGKVTKIKTSPRWCPLKRSRK